MRPIQGTIVRFNLLLNITLALTFIVSTPCFGISTKSIQDSKKATHPFITDEFVRQQVKFWEAIFQKYDGSSVVIHDVDVPLAMIDVINFEKYVMPDGSITSINSTDQTDLVQKYIDRYYLAIDRFKKEKDKALVYGPIEQRIFAVYKREPQMLLRLYEGDIKLRGQTGLSNTFINAAKRAQEYLPYMEQVFKRQGLPIELTRLPFVESMFNLNAKSKVGASGIWQFMPETAREFMSVNTLVDERNNPLKATHAAAQLMQINFKELGNWPLAITSYNHGRVGMQKAKKQLGTMSLGKIINNYKSPSFGFASKNFYAEFLAAVSTYDYLKATNKIQIKKRDNSKFEHIILSQRLSLREVSKRASLSPTELSALNLCLNSAAGTTHIDTPLPTNYVLRLPKDNARILKQKKIATSANSTKISGFSKR